MRLYFISFFVLISTLGFAQKSVKASYYHDKFEGRTTASGTIYKGDGLTCAHKTLPFGTRLKVVNPKNKHFVIVEVTDRGPFIKGREIDLSYAAADQLDIIEVGVAQVVYTKLHDLKTPNVNSDDKNLFFAENTLQDIFSKLNIAHGELLYTQKL